jgi:hypothetical protein
MRKHMQTVCVISAIPPLLLIIQIPSLFLLEILSRRLDSLVDRIQ